jgi:asparagine synthase (glutamine-hydrolysing)
MKKGRRLIMCGFTGWLSFLGSREDSRKILKEMNRSIKHRGPDEEGYFEDDNIHLGQRRLIVLDPEGGKQPMTNYLDDKRYTIVYNGEIYNYYELRDEINNAGLELDSNCDTEMVLKGYMIWGTDVLKHLNGIFAFAIWDNDLKRLFLARDRFGVKPLFYTIANNNFIFGSEIKALLKFPEVKHEIDEFGIGQLFGFGPARIPCSGVFKNIYELGSGKFMLYTIDGMRIEEYWKLENKEHTDDINTTISNVRDILIDDIRHQLISDVPLGTMLSGGLDSSIVTAISSIAYEEKKSPLKTFSVDYIDNDINFVKSDFQPNSDNEYIKLMKERYNLEHKFIVLDTDELVETLREAMIARDLPGMADVDSSLYLFCREIKKDVTVAISGEYADEVFGGYPWFYREDTLNSNTFPWSLGIEERQKLLSPDIKINLREIIDHEYNRTMNEVDGDKYKKMMNLNFKWFGATLIDRADRMSMAHGLEVRVPFTDHVLAEYIWNIPWEMKTYNNMEKGILREALKEYLPEEIYKRKKSPYPKTHNPNYTIAVKNILNEIIEDNDSPILDLINKEYVKEIIETNGTAFTRPWFGQLMTGPQLMAYLIQLNMWLEEYRVQIHI